MAELCIRHGVHYVDLADDAAFVRGIDRLAEAALKADVLVCSGASTAPAITGAVVEEALKTGPVERVAFGIMPGNDAPRGPALVATILGGAGRPIADQPGRHVWGSLRRMRLPGLGRRWVAACDLPEPALFAQRFGIRDTYAGAGMELSILHVGLWSLSWLVRGRLLRSLAPATPLLVRIADRLRFLGTDRGGLRMELQAGATEPRLVPDRRGRRRSLHPGHAGGGADPQARARRLAPRRHAVPGLADAGGNRSRVAAGRPAHRRRLGREGRRPSSVALPAGSRPRLRPPIARRPGAARCGSVTLAGALRGCGRRGRGGALPCLVVPTARRNRRRRHRRRVRDVRRRRDLDAPHRRSGHALAAVHRCTQAVGLDCRAVRHPRFRPRGARRARGGSSS